ncbi:MAG: hypothetical protein WAV41_05105 [Microgenomates group bacterium]
MKSDRKVGQYIFPDVRYSDLPDNFTRSELPDSCMGSTVANAINQVTGETTVDPDSFFTDMCNRGSIHNAMIGVNILNKTTKLGIKLKTTSVKKLCVMYQIPFQQ